MVRAFWVIFVLVCWLQNAHAQVVFKGPSEIKANKLAIITLDKVDGTGLKVLGLFNGKPVEIEEWQLLKNLDNQTIIFLSTDREGVYTFVGSVIKDTKVLSTVHVLTVGSPAKPVVPDTSFKGLLKAAPKDDALSKLVDVLNAVIEQDYKDYDEMETVLHKTADKFLKTSDMRQVRDMIGDEIGKRCGVTAASREINKVKAVYKEALEALAVP